ncbi:MAG: radical SAM family heme chaperone HemW [Gammaproteobacteria bacterium]
MADIPLSLYIHIPWCIRKCPYCDFNSHAVKEEIPEALYIKQLIADLEADLAFVQERQLISIFMGGGTPSLFSPDSINKILHEVENRIAFSKSIEITLEANPGTVEQERFEGFRAAGVNRLSIGCQSFQTTKLKSLGRIHDEARAIEAVKMAKEAGFQNLNIDLMFGLPDQTIQDALFDLKTAISLEPTHISWYQLTLEPNTLFHVKPPTLPNDEIIWEMQQQGLALLKQHHYLQYEVSAYSQVGFQCHHNLNYWKFGDYLGIGAGAHSKITDLETAVIKRFWKLKQPKAYLEAKEWIGEKKIINENSLPFEFMLNALRLSESIDKNLFSSRTGLPWKMISPVIKKAESSNLLIEQEKSISLTPQGRNFLNDLVAMFLESS